MKITVRIETDNDLIIDITDVWHGGIDPTKVQLLFNRILRCFYLPEIKDPDDMFN